MQRAVRCGVSIASRHPARIIAGRRYAPATFRQPLGSPRALSIFPLNPGSTEQNEGQRHDLSPNAPLTDGNDGDASIPHGANGKERNGTQGATPRRWRTRKIRDIPPIEIPAWFLRRNVKLHNETERSHLEGDGDTGPFIEVVQDAKSWVRANSDSPVTKSDTNTQATELQQDQQCNDGVETHEAPQPVSKYPHPRDYRINELIFREVKASLSASLSSPSSDNSDSLAASKSHLKLCCPVDGATYFLDRIISQVASQVGADVIQLDAQDLAEIAGDYLKERSLWNLGFDAQQSLPTQSASRSQKEEEDEEDGENESGEFAVDEDVENFSRLPKSQGFAGVTAIPLGSMGGGVLDIGQIVEQFRKSFPRPQNPRPASSPFGSANIPGLVSVQPASSNNNAQQWNDIKLNALLEVLVEANLAKRSDPEPQRDRNETQDHPGSPSLEEQGILVLPPESDANSPESETASIRTPSASPPPKTILSIRGFRELHATEQGRLIIEKITHIIQRKRREGQAIMIVGTLASSTMAPHSSRTLLKDLQSEDEQSPFRTILVTPESPGPSGGVFYRDERRWIRETNTRHLHAMISKLSSGSNHGIEAFEEALGTYPYTMPPHSILDHQLLSFDDVHRLAVISLGLRAQHEEKEIEQEEKGSNSYVEEISYAVKMLDRSDKVKTEWAREEQQLQNPSSETSETSARSQAEDRLKKLQKQCTHHERSLLKGVVHTENIRTTFADVHAPEQTVESLKNLTMLSLLRPEAFKYGVLATDKITGCLLYGPPGTGKTLLAKAVAKESGATVLEVSGSDVNDMYVGESEKNVRAIFSLAKKLSPCVVFIDEADAIFASRGSSSSRTSHRELINQFLREWDGMTDTNAFIMVATNRPFDLDDAALRRLPRRLLVDLPVEKDREAILKIHLKDENVNPDVSLSELAAKTSLYSGSDLKNMCVSAALAAVKEENDAATKHDEEKNKDDPVYKFPEQRTLEKRHFEKAMDEITASVSEDMSSLGAIRKFDEKYGDRRGRKKKGGYGFAGGETAKQDTAKVRS